MLLQWSLVCIQFLWRFAAPFEGLPLRCGKQHVHDLRNVSLSTAKGFGRAETYLGPIPKVNVSLTVDERCPIGGRGTCRMRPRISCLSAKRNDTISQRKVLRRLVPRYARVWDGCSHCMVWYVLVGECVKHE